MSLCQTPRIYHLLAPAVKKLLIIKVKQRWSSPCTRHKGVWGNKVIALLILNLGTRLRWEVNFTPQPLYSSERASGIHEIGDCVGPRASLDALAKRKNLSFPETDADFSIILYLDPYTDGGMPAPSRYSDHSTNFVGRLLYWFPRLQWHSLLETAVSNRPKSK
jgi:hypothetical protein